MPINETEDWVQPGRERRKVPGVDNLVRQADHSNPNGRTFKSETFCTPLPDRAHIYSTARQKRNGYETLISVNVEPADVPLPEMGNVPPYTEIYEYFNRTSRPIKVTNKHNVTWTLPKPRFWSPTNTEYFVVRKRIRFNSADIAISVLFNHQVDAKYLTIDDGERDQIINLIDEKHRTGALRSPNAHVELSIDRIIPIDLFNNFAAIYVSDIDLMFRHESTDIGSPHPTSQDAVIRGEILDMLGDRRVTGMLYEIVDNDNQYTSRYVCAGKTVMPIPIHRDDRREPGIYHAEVNNVNAERLHVSMHKTALADAESLGIYKTREEAATKGHVQEAFKVEMLRLQNQAQEREQEIEQLKLERQAAQDALTHERKMNELRLDMDKTVVTHAKDRLTTEVAVAEVMLKQDARIHQDQLERRSLVRKDDYEDRTYRRKDTSEIVKWIPTIITAGLALATAVVAARSKA